MKFLLSLIICLAIFKAGAAYVFHALAPKDPDNFGKCIYNEQILKKGKNTVKGCIEIYCNDDGSYHGEHCLEVYLHQCTPGDFVNPDSEFPDCCKKKWTCKSETGQRVIEY